MLHGVIYDAGEVVPCSVEIRDSGGDLYDPDTSVKLTITNPSGTDIVDAADMVNDGVGLYHYNWISTTSSATGLYRVVYTSINSTLPTIQNDTFELATTSPMGTRLADIVDLVSNILEDSSNTIFSDDILEERVEEAVREVSRYVPYESEETVNLTASSKKVDITYIPRLLSVVKAEFPLDKDPPEYRNVKRFGNTLTIDVNQTSVSGDTAKLYCRKLHYVDDSASTLNPELDYIVANLAAAKAAMNNVGDGRTQIQSAIDAIALISSSTDNMTARLTQVASDIGSARTQITAFLTDADTAITAAGTTLETAMTTLGNADTASSIPLTTELSAVDTALGLAITDLDIARSAKADLTGEIATAVEEVNKAIDQAREDIASARTLNNTITVSSNAEAKLQSAALAEINAAQAYLAEIRSESGDSAGVGATSNITGNDINIAMGYLSKARTMLSEIANESSLKASVGIKEVSAANGYINQARAIVSRTVNTINGYLTAASREISLASGYLSQAGGYAKEASARLSVANVISSYQRWGQQLYGLTIQELKQMAKPKIFHTYTRS